MHSYTVTHPWVSTSELRRNLTFLKHSRSEDGVNGAFIVENDRTSSSGCSLSSVGGMAGVLQGENAVTESAISLFA
jgi:hypothetical protein